MFILKFLERYATWRNTIILLAAQFAVQGLILFVLYPRIGGQGFPLDVRPNLSVPEIQEYLRSIGAEGRKLYAINEAIVDVLFPLLYSFAYSFLLFRLLLPMTAAASRWRLLALLPFAIAAADVCENASILGSIATFEAPGAWFHVLIVFNAVKGALILFSIGVLFVVAGARLAFRRVKREE